MRSTVMTALLLGALALVLAGAVRAGVLPSPFHDEIGKLGAVVNVLESVDGRLEAVLTVPPDDMRDPEGLIGAFEAMANLLGVQQGRVEDVIDGLPPYSLLGDPEVEGALLDVRDAADSIAERARAGFSCPPNDQRVLDALADVGSAAEEIGIIINAYIGTPSPID